MSAAVMESAFNALASIQPADYALKANGTRAVRSLYQGLQAAGLSTHAAASDVDALHIVFDVALNKGLGCLILDYIEEVCDSRTMVSSDPVDALLLDGETVRQWCIAATQRSRATVAQQLNQARLEQMTPSSTQILQHESASVRMLLLIYSALAQPGSTDSLIMDSLTEATQLQQLLQALEWMSTQPLTAHVGRHASVADWRSTVNKRMQAAADKQTQTFLQDLLDQLAESGVQRVTSIHPPENLSSFLQALLLQGQTDTPTWHCKLALLMYVLADRQGSTTRQRLDLASFREAFDLQRSQVEEWYCQFLLDDALTDASSTSLDAACCILPGIAAQPKPARSHASDPFKFVQTFAALDRPHAALSLLRARSHATAPLQASEETALEQAQIALKIRLQCGVFTEAISEMQKYCNSLGEDVKAEHTAVLVTQLANWAVASRKMQHVIKLPLDGLQEQILVKWFHEQCEQHNRVAFMMPLYYLQRGRTAEALHAYSHVKEAFQNFTETSEQLEKRQQLESLLASAAGLLPAAQQGLITGPQEGNAPALALAQTLTAPQGTSSIMKGIHNLQLQGNSPALVTRPQGQLQPPLLTSAVGHYQGSLPDLPQQQQQKPAEPAVEPMSTPPTNRNNRSSQIRQSVRKPSSPFGSSASIVPGRGLLTQPLSRPGTPGAFATKGVFEATAAAPSPNADIWSTPTAGQSSRQEEEFRTPGTLTQDEWNTMMQSGSAELPVSSKKPSGRKGFRPAVKKQRLGADLTG